FVSPNIQEALARASVKVAEDGDRFKFNTSISALMILMNELEIAETIPANVLKDLIIMLAPFAPHLAEHLWERLGGEGSVHQQTWPVADLVAETEIEITVQVNGKRRGSVTLAHDASEEVVKSEALRLSTVVTALGGKEPKRVIYVPGKILNLVV
ncbi:MAG: class I tRNA ligase family protein, partial [Candidatus Paceibacterota bacterium]